MTVDYNALFDEYIEQRFKAVRERAHLLDPDYIAKHPIVLLEPNGVFVGDGKSGVGSDDFTKVKEKLEKDYQFKGGDNQTFFAIVNKNSNHWDVVRYDYDNSSDSEPRWKDGKNILCMQDGACAAHAILNIVLNDKRLIENLEVTNALQGAGFFVEDGVVYDSVEKKNQINVSNDPQKALEFLIKILGSAKVKDHARERVVDSMIANLNKLKAAIDNGESTKDFWIGSEFILYFAEVAGVLLVNEGRVSSHNEIEKSKSDFRSNVVSNLASDQINRGEQEELDLFLTCKQTSSESKLCKDDGSQYSCDELKNGLIEYAKSETTKNKVDVRGQEGADTQKESLQNPMWSFISRSMLPEAIVTAFDEGGDLADYDLNTRVSLAYDLSEAYSRVKGVRSLSGIEVVSAAVGEEGGAGVGAATLRNVSDIYLNGGFDLDRCVDRLLSVAEASKSKAQDDQIAGKGDSSSEVGGSVAPLDTIIAQPSSDTKPSLAQRIAQDIRLSALPAKAQDLFSDSGSSYSYSHDSRVRLSYLLKALGDEGPRPRTLPNVPGGAAASSDGQEFPATVIGALVQEIKSTIMAEDPKVTAGSAPAVGNSLGDTQEDDTLDAALKAMGIGDGTSCSLLGRDDDEQSVNSVPGSELKSREVLRLASGLTISGNEDNSKVFRNVGQNQIEVVNFSYENSSSASKTSLAKEELQKRINTVVDDTFSKLSEKGITNDDMNQFIAVMKELAYEKIESNNDHGKEVGFKRWSQSSTEGGPQDSDIGKKLMSNFTIKEGDLQDKMNRFRLISSTMQKEAAHKLKTASNLTYGNEKFGARSYRICQLFEGKVSSLVGGVLRV